MKGRRSPELRAAVRRLTLRFTGLMLLIVVLLGGVVFGIVSQSAGEAAEEALFGATRIDSPQDAPDGIWIAVWRDGAVETSNEQIPGLPDLTAREEAMATQGQVRTTMNRGGRTFDVLTVADGGGQVQVARDRYETSEELDRLLWALAIAGGVAIVCSAVGSAWMARQAIQPMADALVLQRRFVADAGHELRTPLTLLSTRVQLARRRLIGGDVADADPRTVADLNSVVEDVRRLTGIVEDMLIAADTRSVPPHTVVDVALVAREAIRTIEPVARERSVNIRSEGVGDGATVTASETAIGRLFVALLDNAIDYARSQVVVAVAVRGGVVTVRISDDGPGFDASSQARAFDRFATARESDAASDRPRHYGIGLAIVAEIADRAGGSVRIDDAPDGAGASIVVELPHNH